MGGAHHKAVISVQSTVPRLPLKPKFFVVTRRMTRRQNLFRGEHPSVWIDGWMQGAVESGNRAAREVNDAVL